jgi:hypothetical protein
VPLPRNGYSTALIDDPNGVFDRRTGDRHCPADRERAKDSGVSKGRVGKRGLVGEEADCYEEAPSVPALQEHVCVCIHMFMHVPVYVYVPYLHVWP